MSEYTTISSSIQPASLTPANELEINNGSAYKANNDFLQNIQCKLSVGSVNDPLEHEADAMGKKAMRMSKQRFIQRECAHCEEEEKAQRKPLVSFIQKKKQKIVIW